ncbi:hypothetical protein [Pseudarthrobacter sp. SSS035]|uniref:hypothetical protein n=1 Tax=Pseudarthrobacter sp. SSS035 TaxID=2931399 RepID=UPI00200C811A|nr:hypothetical protein [Pseudarthrobacter sp. SSS035]
MNKTFKTATRIAAGSALALSAFAVSSLPAHAAGNEPTFGPLVDGGVVNGPVVDGPLVDMSDTGPFQFGQFQ